MNNSLKEIIKGFTKITVFRHENPDGDALGSQFALKYMIEDNFKDVEVKALGYEAYFKDLFDKSDMVDEDFIKDSLAIVCDTANSSRVDDQRYTSAKKIVKIDHHPNLEPFGDINIVDIKYAATCELLSELFFKEDLIISEKTAKMLYIGILTDTLAFKTNNTTENTLLMASKLVKCGINIPLINQIVFNDDLKTFKFKTLLRNKLQVQDRVGYIVYSHDEIIDSKLKAGDIRGFINEIGNIKELEAWCIFTEKIIDHKPLYDGSLRSKNIAVNTIAGLYNGGGHKNASGVKNLTLVQVFEIISLMQKEIYNCESNNIQEIVKKTLI